MWKWMGQENHILNHLGVNFSSKLDWGSYIISILKTSSKKIGALIYLRSFFLLRLLCKSTMQPCMECCCPVWAGASSCQLELLELLDKLQKMICRTIGPSFSSCLEPLAHRQNVASLYIFYRYYFVDVHLYWLNWLHFLILEGDLLFILIDCMIFLSPFPDVTRMSLSTVSFFAQLDYGILCL